MWNIKFAIYKKDSERLFFPQVRQSTLQNRNILGALGGNQIKNGAGGVWRGQVFDF